MKECLLCDDECESVSHVLWECPAYSSLRSNFLVTLQGKLGDDGFEHFHSRLIVSGKHPIYSVVSCGRIYLVLCLALLKVLCYTAIIPAYNRPNLRLRLGSCRVSMVEGVS